jgi:hypothetical protein
MANKYFNKQVAESRKPLSIGGPLTQKKLKFFDNTDKTPKPKSFDNTDRTDREKIIKDKIKDRLEKLKNSKPELKGMEGFKKVPKQDLKKPESPERKKRQADYMKKHGKNEPSRKTLSVTNSYKKEVEGLK